jgi:DNA protecting protein DprA
LNLTDAQIYDSFLIAASRASHDSKSGWPLIGEYFSGVSDMAGGILKKTPEEEADKTALDRIMTKIRRAAGDVVVNETVKKAVEKYHDFVTRIAGEYGASVTARVISIFDEDYPASLREIEAAPLVIFVAGSNFDAGSNNFSVVGTREPSPYSMAMCEKITDGLARAGFTIVSGMASGIDACAHSSAIKNGVATYAVLGTGFDLVYPPVNRRLYSEILRRGAAISEYLPGEGAKKQTFVLRNRIITGLSRATLVCGAGERSGALISARYAFDQSREVFSIAGDAYRTDLTGCHELIKKNYAKLVLNSADILSELFADQVPDGGEKTAGGRAKKGAVSGRKARNTGRGANMEFDYGEGAILSEDEKTVVSLIEELSVKCDAPPQVERLGEEAARRGIAVGRLLAILSGLELKGAVTALEGKRYQVN